MQTKQFHLGDVLSITADRLLSPSHIEGVYNILSFMTGRNLFTAALPHAIVECRPYLTEQFPQLVTPEMDSAIAELDDALKSKSEKAEMKKVLADWLTKQVAKYGEMFAVKPIPVNAHEVKKPIA